MGGPDLFTSIKCHPDDGLSRVVTTKELVWVDPRFRIKPILAWKHERERDRTLSSHAVGIGGGTRRKFFGDGYYIFPLTSPKQHSQFYHRGRTAS